MIVLDASVLLGFLFTQDAHHRAAVDLLVAGASDDLGASVVTLAAAFVVPTRLGRRKDAEAMLEDIGIVEIPLPERAAARLAALRVETGLTMPDCCVLLTAISENARLATFDRRLATAARGRGVVTLT